ncbi:MAG: pantoate--beta-alanine ligase [Opitutales bacterium]|nr:pantoate--beta-alanine ligase [Opitutales bacterium]
MNVVESVSDLQAWREASGDDIGLVPTMGALHPGHTFLMERARSDHRCAVATIFVNPTQFNDSRDLEAYPRTLDSDLEACERLGMDLIFCPKAQEMYPEGQVFAVTESEDALILEGACRPGHFPGVMTVVMKLLNLVRPAVAYFGEKDYQQLRLIQKMVHAFFLPYKIVGLPTVRETDGLAMSSRNRRLSEEGRNQAPALYNLLATSPSVTSARAGLTQAGFDVEYVEECWGRRLAAVSLDGVRLLDNISLDRREANGPVH